MHPAPAPASGPPRRLDVEMAPVEAPLFHGSEVVAVDFLCPRDHAYFAEGRVKALPALALPFRSSRLAVEDRAPVTVDANGVVLLAPGVAYRREAIDPAGEDTAVFGLAPGLVEAVLEARAPRLLERWRAGLPGLWSPLSLATRRRVDALVDELHRHSGDLMSREARLLAMVEAVLVEVAAFHDGRDGDDPARSGGRTQELVHAVAAELNARIDEPLTLAELAQRFGASSYHLCHAFRRATGQPLHRYLVDLRLRQAARLLREDPKRPLATLALDLGFSSHSHFSTAFRAAFGLTPSAWRRGAGTS